VGVDVATLAVIHGIGFVEVASPPSKLVDYPQYGNRQNAHTGLTPLALWERGWG